MGRPAADLGVDAGDVGTTFFVVVLVKAPEAMVAAMPVLMLFVVLAGFLRIAVIAFKPELLLLVADVRSRLSTSSV